MEFETRNPKLEKLKTIFSRFHCRKPSLFKLRISNLFRISIFKSRALLPQSVIVYGLKNRYFARSIRMLPLIVFRKKHH
jgi:hypothetical protein